MVCTVVGFKRIENNSSNRYITDLPVDNKVCFCRQCRSLHAFYSNRIRSCNKSK